MPDTVDRVLVPDALEAYSPFAVAYRRPGSSLPGALGLPDPRDPDALLAAVRRTDWPNDRAALAETLEANLARLEAPEAARVNARRLGEEGGFAVVAGHQPALFGGPLFLLWKIAGVLRIAADLTARAGGELQFVPVFWNATEDHNAAEFARVLLLDREHDIQRLRIEADDRPRIAAAWPATAAEAVLAEVEELLPETEFMPGLLATIRESMAGSLGQMQTRLLLRWFGRSGLVVLEPGWLRPQAAPVLRRALLEADEARARIAAETGAMEGEGYTPPLPVPPEGRTLVYHVHDDERHRLRTEGEDFVSEECGLHHDRADLLEELDAAPDHFSPSAALRPVVQARILPVAAYVAGGGELAYHRQLPGLFDLFGAAMPPIIPRPAGTILKANLRKTMKRIRIEAQDLVAPGWSWEEVVAAAEERGHGQEDAFQRFEEEVRTAAGALGASLRETGVPNTNELDREVDRFIDRLERVRGHVRQNDPTVGEGARRQYWRLRKFVLPGESYQELSVWTLYFLAFFGEDLLHRLVDEVDPWTDRHHLFIVS